MGRFEEGVPHGEHEERLEIQPTSVQGLDLVMLPGSPYPLRDRVFQELDPSQRSKDPLSMIELRALLQAATSYVKTYRLAEALTHTVEEDRGVIEQIVQRVEGIRGVLAEVVDEEGIARKKLIPLVFEKHPAWDTEILKEVLGPAFGDVAIEEGVTKFTLPPGLVDRQGEPIRVERFQRVMREAAMKEAESLGLDLSSVMEQETHVASVDADALQAIEDAGTPIDLSSAKKRRTPPL